MENVIYIACLRLETLAGEYHYDPCVNPDGLENGEDIKLLACNDLVALQNENEEYFDMLWHDVAPVIFVPVSLEKYRELEDQLNNMMNNAKECIAASVEKMNEALRIMNVPVNKEDLAEQMMNSMLGCAQAGKVLNSSFEIIDRDENYITYDEEDDYDGDEEDYDGDDYEDDYEDDDI